MESNESTEKASNTLDVFKMCAKNSSDSIQGQGTNGNGENCKILSASNGRESKSKAKVVYTETMDQVLLAAVNANEAHILGYGQAAKLFEKVSFECIAHPAFRGYDKISTKSVWDWFKKLKADFKQKEAVNTAASGISEDFTETGKLLQDICDQSDENNLEKAAIAEEKSSKNEELLRAGEEMRRCALERLRKKRRTDCVDNPGNDSESPSSRSKMKDDDQEPEDEFKYAFEQADRRHTETFNLEKRKFELSENLFCVEKEKLNLLQKDQEYRERELSLQERKMDLEEKKFDHQRKRMMRKTCRIGKSEKPVRNLCYH